MAKKSGFAWEDVILVGGFILVGYYIYTNFIAKAKETTTSEAGLETTGGTQESTTEETATNGTANGAANGTAEETSREEETIEYESPTLVLPPWYDIAFMRDDPGPGTWYEPPENPEEELAASNLCGPENEPERMKHYRMAYRELLNYAYGRGKRHFISMVNLLVKVWWCPPTSEREVKIREDLARKVVAWSGGIDKAKSIAATVRNGIALITAIFTFAKEKGLM